MINLNWPKTAFVVCFLLVGIPYWLIPYASVSLPNSLLSPALAVLVICSFLLVYRRLIPVWRGIFLLGCSLPAVVMARVLVEGIQDPTTHNLWPFELVIAMLTGLLFSAGGGVAGWLLRKVV